MGLITSGLFSGINTDDVVTKLMQVERQPLTALQKKEADYGAKISSLGNLLSSLTTFKSSITALKDSSLIGMKATSGDTAVFTMTTDTSASAASHSIKVINIAAAQSIYSTTFANTTDLVADLSVNATQKLQIQVGSGATFTITVDSTNNTLTGIKDAINKAKTDVTASIVNDGTGNRLVLASSKTGVVNKIAVKIDEDNDGTYEENPDDLDMTGLSTLAFNPTYDGATGLVNGGTANLSQSLIPKDASLEVDGLAVTKSSNTISDVIAGVTITLKKDSGGNNINLDVTKDNDSLKAKINALVSAYNALMKTVNDIQGNSVQKGVLTGDSTVRTLASAVKGVTTNTYNNSSLTLLGVTHDKSGVLTFDPATFDKALAADDQSVVTTLNKMAAALEPTLDTYIKTAIPDKQKGYSATTKLLAKREEEMQRRLNKVELDLRKKFNDLDSIVQRLQGQGNYMTQQFEAMSGNK
ncbi:MAG: flagellar filament capping protein FliD [Candidatus Aquicultor sp.]